MRILFVAYCMINNENGDSLIGVYKRSLRIGMEMTRRGHEVWIFCTGRQDYRDELTIQAEGRIRFLDFPLRLLFSRSEALKRRFYRMTFHRLKLDLVVAGEVPLAGTILESTLSAVSLGIPVAVLDNAYSPELARAFVEAHGPMMDGLVLTGPSSFQMNDPPPYYCSAPPYIRGTTDEARELLEHLELRGGPLITVLGYERKAEKLALALLGELPEDCRVILLSPAPAESSQNVAALPESVRARVRVHPPPGENLLFGLLQASQLVIGKSGFMQVSECLALGTPFIGIEYRGCMHPEVLHREAARFVHTSASVVPDKATKEAALRFLGTPREKLRRLHDQQFGAASMVADFLEQLPKQPRAETLQESERMGYSRPRLEQALATSHSGATILVDRVRCSRLRNLNWGLIDSVVVLYRADGNAQAAFLWGRQYVSETAAQEDICVAGAEGSGRQILLVDRERRLLIEKDAGERILPPITI
jgi:hypothetical protein